MPGGRDYDESEWPDESDTDSADEGDTRPCPFCRRPVYEYGDRCPHCGANVTPAAGGRPAWIVWTGLVVLAAIAAPMVLALGC